MNKAISVEQVNGVVRNLLAAGSEIFLPGVGSLYIERHPAVRISKRAIQPPYRAVAFSTRQRGMSLVGELSRTCQIDTAGAQDAYDGWLGSTFVNGTLEIPGVGVLKSQKFTLFPEFDLVLNPQGHAPVQLVRNRRRDWVIWVGAVAVLIAIGFACAEFFHPGLLKELKTGSTTKSAPLTTTIDANGSDVAARQSGEQSETTTSEAAQSASQGSDSKEGASGINDFAAGQYYVVYGVFSTLENAQRAVTEASAVDGFTDSRVYLFGEKFLVSPFHADETIECSRFILQHRDTFPELWIYTAR